MVHVSTFSINIKGVMSKINQYLKKRIINMLQAFAMQLLLQKSNSSNIVLQMLLFTKCMQVLQYGKCIQIFGPDHYT